MPEEQVGEVPPELEAWLSDRAAETGRDQSEVLTRAVAAYRLLDDHEGELAENGAGPVAATADFDGARLEDGGTRLDDAETHLASLEDDLDGLADRLDEHERETDSNVADLRERVVQVLDTARSKADADHDHGALDARLEDVEAALDGVESNVERLEATAESVEADLGALDEQVEGGFENFEAILEGLADAVDDAEGKLDALAGAVVDLRERAVALESAQAQRAAAEELQAEANREGVGVADCEQCGGSVDVALLGTPRCPHCSGVFTGLSPGRRFFGRATLTVGDRPALEGTASESNDPEAVFEDDG